MSSSPRRSTPDADPIGDDQDVMQDIAIDGSNVVDPELEAAIQAETSALGESALRRYSLWVILLVASSISYASLTVEEANQTSLGQRQWCFAILGISLVLSLGVAACFVAPDCNSCTKAFVSPISPTGRYIELFLSVFLLILWCIGLPVIMNPSNGIAVGMTQIVNGNLYIASWVCFGCVLFIVGDLIESMVKGPQGSAVLFSTVYYQRLWETRRGKWFALTAITGIALSECVRIYQAFDCRQIELKGNNTCFETKVAIATTVIAGLMSVMMVFASGIGGNVAQIIEKTGAIITLIVYTATLAVVTFAEGPGHSLGNLFFATWGGFVISVLIASDCFRNSISKRAMAASASVPAPTEIDPGSQIELQGAVGDDSNI